eukprot:m.411794 g.411794  ORF g.411794 m.411794 type:complete len:658 (+) comp56558_c0_seq1:126-2099(+)
MAGCADLARERAAASFSSHAMTHFLNGSEQNTEMRERMVALLERESVFDKRDRCYLTQAQHYHRVMAKFRRLLELKKEHKLTPAEFDILKMYADEAFPTTLHDIAFVPAMKAQCDAAQLRHWQPLMENYEIIGCYCQTELGHGSNVQGIETTATYLPASDQFELHTPTLTASKWWPGALGRTATHGIVYAQLMLPTPDGNPKSAGVHPFVIQLRDMKTHAPLPGIFMGNIGPKMGYNSTDNGFLQLTHVRVARDSLLRKTGDVGASGQYIPPSRTDARAVYASMVNIRALLATTAGFMLSRAATIAVRYLCVRRQFALMSPTEEAQVLDYPTVYHRILPVLAEVYALHMTGSYMKRLYERYLTTKDTELLKEVHATSSGLKATCTWMAAEGIETCRLACGGHGYSSFSEFPALYTTYVGACTGEGDNVLLKLQTAKFLLKCLQEVAEGRPAPGNARYLGDSKLLSAQSPAMKPEDWLQHTVQLHALQHRSAFLATRLGEAVLARTAEGLNPVQAFVREGWHAVRATDAHVQVTMAQSFISEIGERAAEAVRPVLGDLCSLFNLCQIRKGLSELQESGFLVAGQVCVVEQAIGGLLLRVRPNAVALVDAFNFSDKFLNSSLGLRDGGVYADLFARACKDPLNLHPVISPFTGLETSKL